MGVATVIAVAAVVVGGVKAIQGANDKKKAKSKEEKAAEALKKAQDDLKAVDTSNPFEDAQNAYAGLENKMAGLDNVYEDQKNVYTGMENKMAGQENAFEGLENQFEGMENAFEDLTVNTQQAEFEAQQMQQQQANIMSGMAGAAGGSGIAALAQSMANAGALQSQKASASIGSQEAANAKLAAKANQDIEMATAGEGSRLQMAQASEQSRLDTQERRAASDIQKMQMGAEESMQAARLGEASRLQMAEASEGARLQDQEAMGEMEVQKLKGQGDMWSAEKEMQKHQTLMGSATQQEQKASAEKAAGDEKMWGGISDAVGGAAGLSDERVKENIIKIKYSDSGIPIYNFNYKGDNTTWTGTMAQDLIKLGREDAVVTMDNGYYGVKYNLIDVNMKKVKSSPLKQLNQGGAMGATPQEHATKSQAQTDAGLDIIGGGAKILAWEDMQFDIKDIEPESMKNRKIKDKVIFEKERKKYDSGAPATLSGAFTKVGFDIVNQYKEELLEALNNEDEEAAGKVKVKLAALAQTVDIIKDNITEFREDHFLSESLLSKGVSKQQISFATQMYCENPDLIVVYAVQQDIDEGRTDYFGEPVKLNHQYCVVEDFLGNRVMLDVYDGNKDMFIRSNMKATEYITFLNETFQQAQEANAGKAAVKIDLGRINYKINSLFGFNDGTATKQHDELVLMFCHDSEILRDGSTFRRHLYEHPNIKDLNYGGFDWDKLEEILPLGPGDSKHWYDKIDDRDKLLMVDAIINVDNPFFNMKLLRTLVKEYYTYKIENAWWKGMGYDEGKLDLMRLKRRELNKARFERDKAKAAQDGQMDFLFDGKVYPTGMTKAKIKKQKKERDAAFEKNNPTPDTKQTK